ncbi:hypothetical protein PCK1_000784 [Pneumocystis canis]|nr:hypothetical protein PCK1_000784 [Pneumocystis canis]
MREKLDYSQTQKNKRDTWMLSPNNSIDNYNSFKKDQQEEKECALGTISDSKLTSKTSDLSQETFETSNVSYTIGDAGSSWRMMKLGKIYEIASQTGKSVDEVALERYGSFKAFDEAREEKEELERRKTHGPSKEKVTGYLYKQRQQSQELKNKESHNFSSSFSANSRVIAQKSQKGRKFLSSTDSENMTIEEMVKEEKRERNRLYKRHYTQMTDQIVRDSNFKDNLDYYDENAEKLAKRIQKKEIDFRNIAITDLQRTQKILDTCPLCYQDSSPPLAPVISMGTRVYLSLPSPPELAKYHSLIVPIHHRVNTLECDDDEWDEIRNFMKCLIRMADERDHDVIFYENAAAPHRRMHTAIEAVPVPRYIAAQAPMFFREAILSSDEEWSQHQKIIDTLSKARKGLGKMAFRRSISKEAPYFHVWFELDGGIGHIIENLDKWGKSDQFSRQVFATMLDLSPTVWRRRGKWTGSHDPREKVFISAWSKYDWTLSINKNEI